MSKVRRWTLLVLYFLACLVLPVTGAWLLFRSAIMGDRQTVWIGMLVLFGGMTVGPFLLALAGNYFIKSERTRLQQTPLHFAALSKKQQEMLLERKRKTRAMLVKHRERPGRSLLYCLLGVVAGIVIGGVGLFEQSNPEYCSPSDSPGMLIFIGAFLAVLSACAFGLCLRKILRKQWIPEFDAYLAGLDAQIQQLAEEMGKDRHRPDEV